MTVNSAGTCQHCGGKLRNVDGKRYPVPALVAIHGESCPGLYRKRK